MTRKAAASGQPSSKESSLTHICMCWRQSACALFSVPGMFTLQEIPDVTWGTFVLLSHTAHTLTRCQCVCRVHLESIWCALDSEAAIDQHTHSVEIVLTLNNFERKGANCSSSRRVRIDSTVAARGSWRPAFDSRSLIRKKTKSPIIAIMAEPAPSKAYFPPRLL